MIFCYNQRWEPNSFLIRESTSSLDSIQRLIVRHKPLRTWGKMIIETRGVEVTTRTQPTESAHQGSQGLTAAERLYGFEIVILHIYQGCVAWCSCGNSNSGSWFGSFTLSLLLGPLSSYRVAFLSLYMSVCAQSYSISYAMLS